MTGRTQVQRPYWITVNNQWILWWWRWRWSLRCTCVLTRQHTCVRTEHNLSVILTASTHRGVYVTQVNAQAWKHDHTIVLHHMNTSQVMCCVDTLMCIMSYDRLIVICEHKCCLEYVTFRVRITIISLYHQVSLAER